MTPDRFEKMAMQGLGYIAIGGDANRIDEVRRVAILLRRQHAAVVRIIEKEIEQQLFLQRNSGQGRIMHKVAADTLRTVLDAMAVYRKGTT